MTDPCYFRHYEAEGEVHLTVHVDDGAGWASTKELELRLRDLLRIHWPDIKWMSEYGNLMGFKCAHNRPQRTLGFSAEMHIEALKALIGNDSTHFPLSPYRPDIMKLAPETVPEIDTQEWYIFENRVSYCRQVTGSLRHIVKIRGDIAGALNQLSRYAHVPQPEMNVHIRHLVMYLIGTADYGPVYGNSSMTFDDLSLPTVLPLDFELDTLKPPSYYHICLDGALSIDRSTSGILHMYAGACLSAQAFRQHSIAKDIHDSEVFTASTGAAQSIPARATARDVGVMMATPTPIFSDSKSTRLIGMQAGSMKQSIYLARRVMFMREGVEENEYMFFTVAGKVNPSDGLTKYIGTKEFIATRKYMNIISITIVSKSIAIAKISK